VRSPLQPGIPPIIVQAREEMAQIAWNEGFSVGVAEIDRQHKRLMAMINDLDEAVTSGQRKDAISRILDELIIYTATHFRTEEKYFAQYGYPEGEEHQDEHAVCIKMVTKFAKDFNSEMQGEKLAALTDELVSFLGIWWKYHILETDLKYAPFFREKGLR
jgi:hemerythrin